MAAGSGLEGNRESLQPSAANTPDMPPDDVDCIECYLAEYEIARRPTTSRPKHLFMMLGMGCFNSLSN